jgi:hypothetical protein
MTDSWGEYATRSRNQESANVNLTTPQLRLNTCQTRSERGQLHHIACCLVAFCVLERERHDRQLTIYQLKRQLSFQGYASRLPALEWLQRAA